MLDNQEELILNSLIKKYGGRPSDILRDALKVKYDKAFPAYGKGQKSTIEALIPKAELTPEQLCEQIEGAKVITMGNGEKKCEYRDGAFLTKVPLSMVGTDECDPVEINLLNEKFKTKNPK